MTLDLIGGAAGLAYLLFIGLGIRRSRRAVSSADMDRAVTLLMLAALAVFALGAIALMRADGYGWALVSGVVLAGTVGAIDRAVRRADRMEAAR